jgi:biopolymer transport protein ExbD
MPKIKSTARTPHVDMTPMVDLFTLLLTFFLLTATFIPIEPAQITIPNSISEMKTPEHNLITIFIAPNKKIFFNFDDGLDTSYHYRANLLKAMGIQYKIAFTPKELKKFTKLETFGMPMKDIRTWLDTEHPKDAEKLQTGIPMDSIDNQLAWWVRMARTVNPYAEVAIKADGDVVFPVIKKVLDLVQSNGVNRFNFITTYQKEEVGLKDLPK